MRAGIIGGTVMVSAFVIGAIGAEASNCRQRVVVQKVVQVQEVQPVLLAQVVPIPAYQVTYAPGHGDQQALQQRLDKLEAMLIQLLKAPPGTLPETKPKAEVAPGPLKHDAILKAKCAACHDSAVGKVKGNFTLFSGEKLAALTDRQLRVLLTKVVAKEMPPKIAPDLSDDEYQEIVRWMRILE